MPKYSVIIPIYNKEKYISKCIQSVQNQTFMDWELILIDDGSIDKSCEICRAFEDIDSRIHYFWWENRGVVSARQKGIELSNSEYIIHLDADDYWDINLLERINTIIQTFKCDLLMFGYKTWYNTKLLDSEVQLPVNKFYMGEDKNEIAVRIINEYPSLWSKVIKRDLVINDTYIYAQYKDVQLAEDALQLLIPILKAKNIYVSDIDGYNYNIISGSMSHDFKIKDIIDIMNVTEMHLDTISQYDYMDKRLTLLFYQTYFRKMGYRLRKLLNCEMPYIELKNCMNLVRKQGPFNNKNIRKMENIRNMDFITYLYIKIVRFKWDRLLYFLQRAVNFFKKQ